MGAHRAWIAIGAGSAFLLAAFIGAWVAFDNQHDKVVDVHEVHMLDMESDREASPEHGPVSMDDNLRSQLHNARTETERVQILQAVAEGAADLAQVPYIRYCMLQEDSEQVRQAALNAAIRIASREEAGALTLLLEEAISNPHSDVRRSAFKACRGASSPSLVARLLEAADNNPMERFLVIDALATIDDSGARNRVLEAAKDGKLPRSERMRAIALLSKTRQPEAVEYLIELCSSEDIEFYRLAIETLHAIQRRP